jgi:C-terminal peptidase prc
MFRSLLTGLLGTWVLLWAAGQLAQASGDEPQSSGKPFVVLIGIGDYADKQIPPHPHAEDDAAALYDLFTDKNYLGVDAERVRLLLGKADDKRKSQPATRANILKAVKWIATEAKRDDLVIFAFIGQGGPLTEAGDRLCYFASDSTFKDRKKDSVAASDIAQELDKLKSQRFCAFLDVTFKGSTVKEPNFDLTGVQAPYREFVGTQGKEDHDAPAPGRVVYLATSGRQPSLILENHGLFTTAVIEGLKGAADKEGYEPDGVVTVEELTTYLDKQVPDLVHKHGKTKEEKGLTHFVLGLRSTNFVVTKNPAVTAKVNERLGKLDALTKDLAGKDKKLSKELADEGRELLSRMPKLESQRQLRKDYQQLVDGTLKLEKFTEKRDLIVEGAKLKRTVALNFAKKVIEGSQVLREGYLEEMNQGTLVGWAVRGLYRRIDEKIPTELQERLTKAKELKEADLTVLLADARERLGKREDLDNHKDIDIAMQSMTSHLDPYTTYWDPESVSRENQDIQGSFTGIGVTIHKNVERDLLEVTSPIKGGPAYKAGVQAGDLITQIIREVDSDGKKIDPPEVIDAKGMALSEAVKRIQGKPRTEIKIVVDRNGDMKEFKIQRGRVEIERVFGFKRDSKDDWDYMIDPVSKIGYIRLSQFSRNSYRDMAKVMKELEGKKIQGLIFDLRFNPGGLLDVAVKICDMFIDGGLIVTIKPRVGRETHLTGDLDKTYTRFPMVCLVNGGSASGSEIVSACLQDHGRAIIMGERSFGKGRVQNIQPFEGGQLKLTNASFWRPNGKNLDKLSTQGREEDDWGVSPDKGFTLKLSRKEREDLFEHQHQSELILPKEKAEPKAEPNKPAFKDKQLDMALEYLRGQIKTVTKSTAKKAG